MRHPLGWTSIVFWLVLVLAPFQAAGDEARGKCVQVFHDRSPQASYTNGNEYSILLRNLLGHFPEYRQVSAAIEDYRKGQLDECEASFYIGSWFENAIPQAFLDDFATTRRNVAWLGYSIWKLGPEKMRALLGHEYSHLTTLDWNQRDAQGRPTFFKTIHYKGEQFRKYGEFSKQDPKVFHAAWEMSALKTVSPEAEVLATAEHNGNQQTLPYAIRMKNRFYFTDIPFSYLHESDRYLVFCDLLFDILGAKPRHEGKRPAVFRIEDVSSEVNRANLLALGRLLKEEKIPFHVALIPVFADPNEVSDVVTHGREFPLTNDLALVQTLGKLRDLGGKFIWHGVTHQHGSMKNPFTGMSGDDFEFWDVVNNKPFPEDSPHWLLNRLDRGWDILNRAGIHPKIWEVPHYQASALDYQLFARLFDWHIGRIIYFDQKTTGLPVTFSPRLRYAESGLASSAERKAQLGRVKVEYRGNPVGQFFPYEIYGDTYGQKLFPENLGNPSFSTEFGSKPRSIAEMLEDARRNLVIRDAWASFFFHPYIVSQHGLRIEDLTPESLEDSRKLVRGLKALGYRFVDLENFAKTLE